MKKSSTRNKKYLHLLVKYPGREPMEIDIDNSLHSLQDLVEGRIETVLIFTNLLIICNEEGRINGMEYNCQLLGIDFYGPILVAGVKGEEFADTPVNPEGYRILFSRDQEEYYRDRHYKRLEAGNDE